MWSPTLAVMGTAAAGYDDFVICCRVTADEAVTVMRGMMSKLKLTVKQGEDAVGLPAERNV